MADNKSGKRGALLRPGSAARWRQSSRHSRPHTSTKIRAAALVELVEAGIRARRKASGQNHHSGATQTAILDTEWSLRSAVLGA
jgi:hypothetical protein